MQPDHVVQALATGMAAYEREITADIRSTGPGTWWLTVEAAPGELELEVAAAADTVRILWSGGTEDEVTLGDALNYLLAEAGLLKLPRPRGRRT